MPGSRAGVRLRRRPLSSSLTACAPTPLLAAGSWCRSMSSATTATAAPASGVPAWTDCATPPRAPDWTVLITAPDRLARNSVHQVLLVEELQGHGVMVEFLDRPMYAGPEPGWPRSAAPRHAANSVG